MRLTIVTPYRHGEVTLQALRLADFASSYVESVTVLVSGRKARQPVHLFWDGRCRAFRGESFVRLARRTQQWVWCGQPNLMLISAARHAQPDSRHLAWPSWGVLDPVRVRRILRSCDELLCCSGPMYRAVAELSRPGDRGKPELLSWVPPEPADASELSAPGCRVLVVVDTATMRRVGEGVLYLLGTLLGEYPELSVTLLCQGTWSKRLRRPMETAQLAFGDRLEMLRQQPWQRVVELLYSHHALLDLTTTPGVGVVAGEAAMRGVPVIAFATPPREEVLEHGSQACLLQTHSRPTLLGAPRITFSVVSVLEQLRTLLAGGEIGRPGRRTRRFLREVGRCRAFWFHRWEVEVAEGGP